jgi:hypothetical protein
MMMIGIGTPNSNSRRLLPISVPCEAYHSQYDHQFPD